MPLTHQRSTSAEGILKKNTDSAVETNRYILLRQVWTSQQLLNPHTHTRGEAPHSKMMIFLPREGLMGADAQRSVLSSDVT